MISQRTVGAIGGDEEAKSGDPETISMPERSYDVDGRASEHVNTREVVNSLIQAIMVRRERR